MLKIFRQPINVNTPDGYKTAYGIRKLRKPGLRIEFRDSFIETSHSHKFVEHNKITKSKDLKIGDILQNNKIINITDIGKIDVFDLTDVDGAVYYTNDLVSHNCAFLGSSDTLISGEALREIELNTKENTKIPNNVLLGLDMYYKPEEGHSYILTCDPSKDGIDDFSVDVIDVTSFPFVQVATANLQVDYIVMPEHLNELGKYYNDAFIIIENNEGAGQSITDTLWGVYEYPNLYRDDNIEGRKGKKKYTGFRTTTKTRPLILNLMRIFIEEGKLIINSETTLDQLYTFTKRKTGLKYEAEDGFKDDAVMSMALTFAPFMSNKTFDDYEKFMRELRTEDSEIRTGEFLSAIDIGFTADEIDYEEIARIEMRKEFADESYSFN